MSKKKKKKRRISRRAKFYIVCFLLGFIIAALLAATLIHFLCVVKDVEVEGNTIPSDEEVVLYVFNDKYSSNAVYVDLKNKIPFLKAKEIPFVEDYRVSLKDRNTVLITVTEELMLGYLPQADGTYAYFNDKGIVVEISDRLVEGVMPLSGLECDNATVGEKLPVDKKQLNLILSLTKNLKKNDLTTQGIFFDENGDLFMVYDSIFINFGDGSEMASKVMRLPKILPSLEGKIGILHLEKFSLENTDIVFSGM